MAKIAFLVLFGHALAGTSFDFGFAAGSDGGCLMSYPAVHTGECNCNANPTVSKFAACNAQNQPNYFNDSNDIPNGACIMYANGKRDGTSLDICARTSDCLEGLACNSGHCADSTTGTLEANRLVTTCASPKHTEKDPQMAGCPSGDGNFILNCHKWWIGDDGMRWKRYLQFNPLGEGDSYAWAYDEAVCAISGNTRTPGDTYPWC